MSLYRICLLISWLSTAIVLGGLVYFISLFV